MPGLEGGAGSGLALARGLRWWAIGVGGKAPGAANFGKRGTGEGGWFGGQAYVLRLEEFEKATSVRPRLLTMSFSHNAAGFSWCKMRILQALRKKMPKLHRLC